MGTEDDNKSGDKKPAVSFESEGEFLAAVAKKSAKAVRDAVAQAKAELMASLGAESEDDLAGLKAKLDSSKATVTEVERFKAENAKQAKAIRDLEKANGELSAYRTGTLKRAALMPFAARTADKTGETLVDLLGPKLQLGDDGTVTGPDGAKLEDIVNGLLEQRPFLKAPDWKAGAGTTAKPKTDASNAPAGGGDAKAGQQQNGAGAVPAYKALSHAMQQQHQQQSGNGGGASGP